MQYLFVAALILAVASIAQGGETDNKNNAKRTVVSSTGRLPEKANFLGQSQPYSFGDISSGHLLGGSQLFFKQLGDYSIGGQQQFRDSYSLLNSGHDLQSSRILFGGYNQFGNSLQDLSSEFSQDFKSGENNLLTGQLQSLTIQKSAENGGNVPESEQQSSSNIKLEGGFQPSSSQQYPSPLSENQQLQSYGGQVNGVLNNLGKSGSSGELRDGIGGGNTSGKIGGGIGGGATISTVTQAVGIPVAQPYPVTYTRPGPGFQPQPVDVSGPKLFKVSFPIPKPLLISRPGPVTVPSKIPYPVQVPIKVPYPQPIQISVPQPVPITVSQPVPVQQNIVIPVPYQVSAGGNSREDAFAGNIGSGLVSGSYGSGFDSTSLLSSKSNIQQGLSNLGAGSQQVPITLAPFSTEQSELQLNSVGKSFVFSGNGAADQANSAGILQYLNGLEKSGESSQVYNTISSGNDKLVYFQFTDIAGGNSKSLDLPGISPQGSSKF